MARLEGPFFEMPPFRFAGGVLITMGVIGSLDCFFRFAVQGLGTPAPVFSTRHLTVTGLIVMSEIRCTKRWSKRFSVKAWFSET
jgi:hypothetical protein